MGLFSRSEPATHFPEVHGRRLDGTDVAFPADLPADATLLVVSFVDDLDPLADQWARLGEKLAEGRNGRLTTLECPVVGKGMKWLGDLGTVGIRGQVEDETERERTVPLYVDKKDFRKALHLKGREEVTAFLVARDGRIAWRGEGGIDMDEVVELEQAITEVLSAPPAADGADPEGPAADRSI